MSGRSKKNDKRRQPAATEKSMQMAEANPEYLLSRFRELETTYDMLRGFIDASTEAMWCIEFSETVDIAQSDDEIIRQIFENKRSWRFCNEAMSRLYNLPANIEFNDQPVDLYFPRNRENESFIRQVIDNDFSLDNAPSIDVDHNGQTIYAENTVRCHIEGATLFRLYGTARDLTEIRRKHNRLQQREIATRSILNTVPDPILVIEKSGVLQSANKAFEENLGWSLEQYRGNDISPIIAIEPFITKLRSRHDIAFTRAVVPVNCADSIARFCDMTLTQIIDGELAGRFVVVLRVLGCVQEEP